MVEIHYGSDMGMDVKMFYENEKRFSLKIRGIQLFDKLSQFFNKHKWFKGNHYTSELNKDTK